MKRVAPRIGVEILIVMGALGLLAGALGLVVIAHRRSLDPIKPPPVVVLGAPDFPEPATEEPSEPARPTPTPVDLTPERLKPITAALAEQKALTADADRLASEVEKAAVDALADFERWKSRERLIRSEVAAREKDAIRAEDEADALAIERDVLAEKRDELKSKLEKERLRARDGVAVLPYKGPNGTWRRPIAIECRGSGITLQPGGPYFTLQDLLSTINPRRSPLILAVARTMLRVRSTATPDGAASVPYLLFVVRPDGVKSYYAARTLLEPLGISYGYELADADWDIEYPDLDDPSEWTDRPAAKKELAWPPPVDVASPSGEGIPSRSFGSSKEPGSGLGDPTTGQLLKELANRGSGGSRVAAGTGAVGAFNATPGSNGGSTGLGESTQGGGPGGLDPRGSAATPSPGGGLGGLAGNRPQGDGLGGSQGANGKPGSGSGWGQIARKPGSGLPTSADMADLEAITRGDFGGRPTPADGRIPWHPGMGSEMPSLEPAPPSGLGSGMGPGRASNGSSASGSSSNPGGSGIFSPGASSGVGNPAVENAATAMDSYREAIARRNGLVTPRGLSPPSRSGGGSATPSQPSGSNSGQFSGSPPSGSSAAVVGTVGGPPSSSQPAGTAAASPPPGTLQGDQPFTGALASSGPPAGSNSGSSARNNSGSSAGMASSGQPSSTSGGQASGGGQTGGGQPGGRPSGSQSGTGMAMGGQGSGDSGQGFGGRDPFASQSLQMTVSCEKTGVTIRPGGTTISIEEMTRDDSIFASKLRDIVHQKELAEPELGVRPKIKFLVQPGGEVTYLKARWQATNGTSYPSSWQVVNRAGPSIPDWGKP